MQVSQKVSTMYFLTFTQYRTHRHIIPQLSFLAYEHTRSSVAQALMYF